jgi:ankyrin repeat protein
VGVDRANAAARDENGLSALLLARYHGHADIVEILLAAGLELDAFEAAATGQTARLSELTGDASAVRACSSDGFTPLHLASFFGHDDAVELLLERGADVNAVSRNPMRVMPLHSAVAGKHSGIARRLVAAGADVGARQQDGFTPLHEAAQNGDGELVELLLDRGADAGAQLDDGRTAADLAQERGHAEVAARLGDA